MRRSSAFEILALAFAADDKGEYPAVNHSEYALSRLTTGPLLVDRWRPENSAVRTMLLTRWIAGVTGRSIFQVAAVEN